MLVDVLEASLRSWFERVIKETLIDFDTAIAAATKAVRENKIKDQGEDMGQYASRTTTNSAATIGAGAVMFLTMS